MALKERPLAESLSVGPKFVKKVSQGQCGKKFPRSPPQTVSRGPSAASQPPSAAADRLPISIRRRVRCCGGRGHRTGVAPAAMLMSGCPATGQDLTQLLDASPRNRVRHLLPPVAVSEEVLQEAEEALRDGRRRRAARRPEPLHRRWVESGGGCAGWAETRRVPRSPARTGWHSAAAHWTRARTAEGAAGDSEGGGSGSTLGRRNLMRSTYGSAAFSCASASSVRNAL
ncbi:uncharacterized protein LOC112272407 [Brachypodium distachyon]|uniref:uncharacterized protein LOC112272407 n=1 Tax=Brachypodium distachyon TaxID=15368 RepID=UPI000D0E1340|nr:uncharacterized protein LOC112272407 [Brachypodium distachyon]|eukprot:XP_024318854.1 uncharacterized protein LOC112272407 [Brachypodium distachyon]